MKIRVLYFASTREITGKSTEEFEIPTPCSLGTLKNILSEKWNGLCFEKNRIKIAVNKKYCEDKVFLGEGDEVALIPPIAGG